MVIQRIETGCIILFFYLIKQFPKIGNYFKWQNIIDDIINIIIQGKIKTLTFFLYKNAPTLAIY